MSKRIQLRRGTTAEMNAFTGAVGEVTVDTDKDTVVVHDGTTVGGHPVATRANDDGTISLIKKDGTSAGVINNGGLFNNTLTSTNTNQALTAAQGKALKDLTDTKLTVTNALGGAGQTLQDLTASRVLGTTYTNSTGRPIWVSVAVTLSAGSTMTGTLNGIIVCRGFAQEGASQAWSGFIVPNGATYSVTGSTITSWVEVR